MLLSIGFPVLAHADDASKAAKIEEMLTVTHADRMMEQMMGSMQSMVANQMKQANLPEDSRAAAEEMQKRIMDLVASKMSWDKIKPVYVQAYSETFTEQEIDGAVQFYKSPAGQAILEKMPVLLQKTVGLTQQLMGDLMPEITKMMEEMKAKSGKK